MFGKSKKYDYQSKIIASMKSENEKLTAENNALKLENDRLERINNSLQESIDMVNSQFEQYERQHKSKIDLLDMARLKYSVLVEELIEIKKDYKNKIEILMREMNDSK